MTRLQTLAPNVSDVLKNSSAAKQRAAAVAACQFAVLRTDIGDSIVQTALQSLITTGGLEPPLKADIEARVARLDREYFDLQDATESDRLVAEDSLKTFGQARAAAAILAASSEDPFEAASEAIYEAAVSVNDPEPLFSLIAVALR